MATTLPVFTSLKGMATDPPLDQTPAGFMRRILNATPGRGMAPVQVRGGWAYGTGVIVGAQPWDWLVWAPFTGNELIITYSKANKQSSQVSVLNGTTTGSILGSGPTTTDNVLVTAPFFHRTPDGGMVVYPNGWGSPPPGVPSKCRGSFSGTGGLEILSGIAGTPNLLNPDRGASWGDYLILAGDCRTGSARKNANRMWFSDVGNPEGWASPDNRYIDIPEDIVAIVPRGNIIFVFGAKGTHILTGDQPPGWDGSTGIVSNMTQKKFAFSQGLSDPDAVTTYKDFVLWANANGVYRSDGSQPSDLTSIGGISSYWPFCYSPAAGDTINLGCYRQYLVVTVLTSGNAFKRCLVFDLENNTWWEWDNIVARHLLRIPSWGTASEDLLWPTPSGRIARLAPVFDPGSVVDGDLNEPILKILTGGMRFGALGEKRLRRGFVTFAGDPTRPTILDLWGSVDEAIDMGLDPTTDPLNLFSLTPQLGPNAAQPNRVIRVPLRIHRKAELIRYLVTGKRELRIYGLEQEIVAYDDTRGGDLHA